MSLTDIPQFVRDNYLIQEWRHASAILINDFPNEWKDIMELLQDFKLLKSYINTGGGNKSTLAKKIDSFLIDDRGWIEKSFDVKITIDNESRESPTHKIDCVKNRVGFELEWNNKDPFYDRDLNNFRLLFEMQAISVGVILTRADELQDIFNELGRGSSYGNSTTHWGKLIPRLEGGAGGGCPILAFGITKSLYVKDC